MRGQKPQESQKNQKRSVKAPHERAQAFALLASGVTRQRICCGCMRVLSVKGRPSFGLDSGDCVGENDQYKPSNDQNVIKQSERVLPPRAESVQIGIPRSASEFLKNSYRRPRPLPPPRPPRPPCRPRWRPSPPPGPRPPRSPRSPPRPPPPLGPPPAGACAASARL